MPPQDDACALAPRPIAEVAAALGIRAGEWRPYGDDVAKIDPALLDNHLYWGNALRIDPRRVLWNRVLDMNDRALRNVIVGLGGP